MPCPLRTLLITNTLHLDQILVTGPHLSVREAGKFPNCSSKCSDKPSEVLFPWTSGGVEGGDRNLEDGEQFSLNPWASPVPPLSSCPSL